MDTKVLNELLASHKQFVFIARRSNGEDNPESPREQMLLQRIEALEDGRLLLHLCEPGNSMIQRVLGQCELGEDTFVSIREGPEGDNRFWLSDSGWKVANINLSLLFS